MNRDERHGQAPCVEADLCAASMAEIADDVEILRLLRLYLPSERKAVVRELRRLGIEIGGLR